MNLYTQFKQQEAELLKEIDYLKNNKTKIYKIFKTLENRDIDYVKVKDYKLKLSQFYKDNLFWANEINKKLSKIQMDLDNGDCIDESNEVLDIINELQQIKQECQGK